MLFWNDGMRGDATAIVGTATNESWTYAELGAAVDAAAKRLEVGRKALVFLFARSDPGTLISYLAALEAGHAVALLDGTAGERATELLARYEPEVVIAAPGSGPDAAGYESLAEVHGYSYSLRTLATVSTIHDDLGVLLTTSGSTGSPKLVRLSRANVVSNAASIAKALEITDQDRPITTLPIFYSYGLSVINSHLLAGASIFLCEDSVMTPAFWEAFRSNSCTSLAGVPFTYELFKRIGVFDMDLPSLGVMTQAGGRLDEDSVMFWHEHMTKRGGRFFVMYGQTEATARMAYMPPEMLPAKLGSAGRAIPDGDFRIDNSETDAGDAHSGEVVYEGPNVMMGYASNRADLDRGDDLSGVLRTGDVGFLDEDGYLFLTGRNNRFAKLFGLRVNLQDVEKMIAKRGPTAALAGDNQLKLYCAWGTDAELEEERARLAAQLRVVKKALVFVRVDEIPRTGSGKIDYAELARA